MWSLQSGNVRNTLVFLAAALVTAAVAAAFLLVAGFNDEAFGLVLRRSAHASFLLLLVVFVARPLAQLRPSPATRRLLSNRRLLGIAFAGIHTAHLALIVTWDRISPNFDFIVAEKLPGAFIYLTLLAMLVTSYDAPARALGPRRWRILHKAGLYIIFVAFLPTLVPESRTQLFGANGLLLVLAATAITIRLLAFLQKRHARERQPA